MKVHHILRLILEVLGFGTLTFAAIIAVCIVSLSFALGELRDDDQTLDDLTSAQEATASVAPTDDGTSNVA